jgi:hypothetical protein
LEENLPQARDDQKRRRYSTISNTSDNSFRNSMKDSDSDADGTSKMDNSPIDEDVLEGSKYLRMNPASTFDEMLDRIKAKRESKIENDMVQKKNSSACNVKPGKDNLSISMLL